MRVIVTLVFIGVLLLALAIALVPAALGSPINRARAMASPTTQQTAAPLLLAGLAPPHPGGGISG